MTQNGLHHVTAIAGPARRNAAFYTETLGLRLVKKTVNFDDPGTYHFYFGDELGRPGSILTFFPWEHAAPGRLGIGETQETVFRVPEGALGFWTHRFVDKGVEHGTIEHRFGTSALPFRDPDGTRLALVGVPGAADEAAWTTGEIGSDVAIRGMEGVSLLLKDVAPTAAILTDVFGFRPAGSEGSTHRFVTESGPYGTVIDLRGVGEFLPARMGAGSVHHIAFRAGSDAEQAAMVARLGANHRIRTTEQKDRNYFRSVYFREPGGVLFEIATDDPGFAVDEAAATLGSTLKLPPQYEPARAEIERVLPELA
ncbi:ring-cleaving dioxygenase [Acuticoccus mangrovi]|uniref:Ring-cleaving dioxygenase n=1 Tax=Acuticoccus mangrovi TaxID=2796142 RepID=A0A934IVB1_9HYPH|nr:ring-cleaving dioxygenase [Acuticoccus mangrovi]MBJ3778792.1 ring-cleaving dioxygenase [Acuticoccus mangrovi]